MPRDKRLYMTFANDFPEHPKIKPLSDNAFRTFVEMNGYSRTQDLDGRVPVAVAKTKWKARALTELQSNHPERPSLMVDGNEYVIRDYAEHQETKASVAARQETNRANGAKGGRPRAKRSTTEPATQSVTGSVSELKANQKQSQRSESEIETDVTYDSESGHLGDARAADSDAFDLDVKRARTVGIEDLRAVRAELVKATAQEMSFSSAVVLAEAILTKAARQVRNVDAYLATVCRRTPAEVQQAYFDLDIEAYGVPA